jgi:hypothetical protein
MKKDMEQKTKIAAEDNKQELLITREFDLPLELSNGWERKS